MKFPALLGLLGSLAVAGGVSGAAAPAFANEALPAAMARDLDRQPAEFTASAAKMRRMMIIQNSIDRQNGYRNRGYGPRPGYGPRSGYGYGPRPGYRHHRGYDDRPRY